MHNYKLKEENYYVTQFRNRSSFFELIWSFKDGLLRGINDASRFLFTWSLIGGAIKTLLKSLLKTLLKLTKKQRRI